MVDLYSGTPGSGKSLHCAKVVYTHLKLNRPIICNFQINLDKIKRVKRENFIYCPNDKLTPQYLIDYAMNYWQGRRVVEDRIFLVIDECQLMFNAREWQKAGREVWLSFFTQHRKLGYHIILIAQFDRMIDRYIRSLIEYEYIHRKIANIGIGGAVFNIVAGGKLFIMVQKYYPLNERIGVEFFKARKKYYSLYDTYGTF